MSDATNAGQRTALTDFLPSDDIDSLSASCPSPTTDVVRADEADLVEPGLERTWGRWTITRWRVLLLGEPLPKFKA